MLSSHLLHSIERSVELDVLGARVAPSRTESRTAYHCTGRALSLPDRRCVLSIAAIAWSWKQDLRPTEKFILVAISDHANDEDFTCWPSLTHLETKTGYNRTTIWRAIDRLVNSGLLSRVGEHKSGSTLYKVMIGALCTYVKPATQVGAQNNTLGAHSNKVGAQDTPNHKNHNEPSLNITTAKFMFNSIRSLNPKHREPNFDSWANEIRLMRERDGRTDAEIRDLFSWANQHHFWKTNILSPATLRKQWDKLVIQRNHNGDNNGTHKDTRSRAKRFSDKLDDIARRDIEQNGHTDKLG